MAKSYNHLWHKMLDKRNIRKAIFAAARGKRKKNSVRKALADVKGTIDRIYTQLKDGTWQEPTERPGHYINDGIKAKRRLIIHPAFDEQIIHHLLVDEIFKPIFMKRFYRWSCGTVPTRGQEEMAKHIMRYVRNHPTKVKYFAKLDIKKCFESANVDAVYEYICKFIRDKKVCKLIYDILHSNTIKLPDGTKQTGGISIGLYTSPWFVNIVLDMLDHYFKDEKALKLYVRYMDDILIMHPNKRHLRKAIVDATRIINRFGFVWKREPNVYKFTTKIRFTGFQFDSSRLYVRDVIYIRARRLARKVVKRFYSNERRLRAYDSSRLMSIRGRFKAFESYNALVSTVLNPALLPVGLLSRAISHKAMLQNIAAKSK